MQKLPRNVRISFQGDTLTHFGGLYLFQSFIRRSRLLRGLSEAVRFRRWNTSYSSGKELLAIVYPILLGLGRVETTRLLRHNGVFQYLTGLPTYPDPTTLRRFLTRLGHRGLRGFLRLHDRLRTRWLKRPAAIFDLDTTVLTVYGKQEKAAVGFNPKKRGRPSFQPLLCFEGGSGICWEGEWLPGDAHPLPHTVPLLERAWAKLPAQVQRVSVRADAAFYDGAFFSYLEGNSVGYAVPARSTKPLANRFGGLAYRAFKGDVEIAETSYQAIGWSSERRMIVIRRPIPEPPSWQLTLFKMGRHLYQVIVTNLDLEPLNLWRFYNQRATMELAIRQWKYGWPLAKSPGRDWAMNAAWFHVVLFAFNLLKWFQRCAAPPEMQSATIPTLRERLLCVPASLHRPQGKATLSLPAGYPYREAFEQTAKTIRRLKPMDFPATGVEPWISQWSAAEQDAYYNSSQKR